jgi:hypothetical protein
MAAAAPAVAADSFQTYSTASQQSAEAAATLTVAGMKTVSGVVAIPLAVAGGGSAAAGSSAQGVADSANASADGFSQGASDAADFASGPLPVTNTVVIRPQPAPQVPYEAQVNGAGAPK